MLPSSGMTIRAAGASLFYAGGRRLVLTGWVLFLPGVLDHFKFTDGLVGHSLLAMAGFTSSLLIFVMVQLLGEDGWIFNRNALFLWMEHRRSRVCRADVGRRLARRI